MSIGGTTRAHWEFTMSIFSAIKDAIFGGPAAAAETSTSTATSTATTAQPSSPSPSSPTTATASPANTPGAKVDIAAILDQRADASSDELDWRISIVDLMKLLDIDSSLKARKQLAQELLYTGDMSDSAKMNVWLHKHVMAKLAENGGILPKELKTG
jgi:hypothetical protein